MNFSYKILVFFKQPSLHLVDIFTLRHPHFKEEALMRQFPRYTPEYFLHTFPEKFR